MLDLLFYSFGTILGVLLFVAFIVFFIFIYDINQTKHTILRNYPVVGHLRYFFERLGEYFRQYFFLGDREEMPFNRATRTWVYNMAKNEGATVGFGSTNDLREVGSIIFVNAPFPILESQLEKTPPLIIGEGYCKKPFQANSVINISGMSYGALSAPAIEALSRGAKEAGCWLNTGEGGVSPHHLRGGGDIIAQIGTAKYGVRDHDGNFSQERLEKLANEPQIKAFELKLSQGAKPGKGGILPADKVTEEIAEIRGIPLGKASISPNRHPDINNMRELLEKIYFIRELTGKPVGIKSAIGNELFMISLCETILEMGLDYAPDFFTVDGGEGGSGAAPQALADHMSLPITEALPMVVRLLTQYELKKRIKVIASGKLVTSAKVAWALCIGADFVNTARGFMFSLGCIQAMRCHTNACPTGITTHKKHLQRGLVIEEKYIRVANYAKNISKEVDMIAHSCGARHARDLKPEHVRIVDHPGHSKPATHWLS